MKIDRLMAITIYLLNHGKTSAQILAKEFEVSPRTIMRDMETLGQAGIPIQSTCGADGGYQIIDTYIMDRQLANPLDYSFIYTALKGLASAYNNKDLEHTLKKISLLSEKSTSIDIDFSVAHENQEINVQIQLLESAIQKQKVVQFHYTNNNAEEKLIQVEPVGVIYKWYNWYLIAYYEKYNDYCMFKLVRMNQLIMTSTNVSRQHSLTEAMYKHNYTPNEIHVRFFGKASVKAKCKEYLNGKIIKEYDNGDFEYSLTVPKNESFWFGVILSCGCDIRILEPQSLIQRMLSTCKNIIEEYGGTDNE